MLSSTSETQRVKAVEILNSRTKHHDHVHAPIYTNASLTCPPTSTITLVQPTGALVPNSLVISISISSDQDQNRIPVIPSVISYKWRHEENQTPIINPKGGLETACWLPSPQHAHPSRSFSMWMLMGSWKSPLNSSDSSCMSAFLAITSKACSTLIASFALVSKYGMLPLDWQKVIALLVEICAKKSVNNCALAYRPWNQERNIPLSCSLPYRSCCPARRTGSYPGLAETLG